MATQKDEPIITASSRASLVDYTDGESLPKDGQTNKRTRRRACPITALLGLIFLLIIAGSGVAISVLIVHFNLQVFSAGTLDLVARVLLFVASCMSIFYVFMHGFAAREHYVRSHGSPQIFGFFTVAVAVLTMRLGVPVWTGSVVMTAYVAAMKGFDIAQGVTGNIVWIQLIISSLGMMTLILMVVITETTDRPFAISIISRRSFLKEGSSTSGRVNTFDLSVSRAGFRTEGAGNGNVKSKGKTELELNQMGFDRSTINTPESPYLTSTGNPALPVTTEDNATEAKMRPLVRVRSQPIPTPLEAVFTSDSSPLDGQDSPRKLAWHPRRTSTHSSRMPQDPSDSAEAHVPSLPRQPSNATARESFSQFSSVQAENLMNELEDASTISDSETTMSPSPALGTPTAMPISGTLRIANPDEEDPAQSREPPTLAKLLSQLSTRAAARRRNSMLVRQADLSLRQAMDENATRAASRTDMAAVLFDQPSDFVEAAQQEPVQRRNSLLVRQADLDVRRSVSISRAGEMSVFSLDPSTEFIEIPRPPEPASRGITAARGDAISEPGRLMRSNTAEPLLVRNFSRPGAPRPRTADGEEEAQVHVQSSDRRGRNDRREEKAIARRSRSLPPARQQRSPAADSESQFKRNVSATGRKKGSQAPIAPRFSPFPKAPVATPPVELTKVKGLGQGSTKRLDERIEKWMNGVPVGEGE